MPAATSRAAHTGYQSYSYGQAAWPAPMQLDYKRQEEISRILIRVVRYEAKQHGLLQDADGWISLEEFVRKMNLAESVEEVRYAAESSKGSQGSRFEVQSAFGSVQVRATYSHKDRPKGKGQRASKGHGKGAGTGKFDETDPYNLPQSAWQNFQPSGSVGTAGAASPAESTSSGWETYSSYQKAEGAKEKSSAPKAKAAAPKLPKEELRPPDLNVPNTAAESFAGRQSATEPSRSEGTSQGQHSSLSRIRDDRVLRRGKDEGSGEPVASKSTSAAAASSTAAAATRSAAEPVKQIWTQYQDPSTGRLWMYHQATDGEEHFFVDQAEAKGWKAFMTDEQKRWWWQDGSESYPHGRYFMEQEVQSG